MATLILEDHARDIWQDSGRFLSGEWGGGPAALTLAFFGCAILSGVLTLMAQSEHMRQSREDESRRSGAENRLIGQSNLLLDQTEQLRHLVQSMPPANFLDVYGRQVELSHRTHVDAYEMAAENPRASDELAQMTRVILRAIGKVFAVYDNAEGAAIGVNIMLFVRPDRLPDPRLDFAPADLSLEELDGALLTDRRLSARTDRQGSEPDPDLVELALPVPKRRFIQAGGREYRCVLPGAPFAWTERTTVAYASQAELLEWCVRECAFPEPVLNSLRDYFRGAGHPVQSFVSLPLLTPNGDAPLGVLNVHSDRLGLLEARPPDEKLHALLKPLLALVVDMLELLSAAEHEGLESSDPAEPGMVIDSR
ncbi:MAG TPA: hypothetical protein VFR37_13550 [Longimicrobium sp.]|nr:hypothetical protein [Longimicrobium sp.]